MVTGTGDFQPLFQGLLSEIAVVQGQPYGVPHVKLSGDSSVGVSPGSTIFVSGGTLDTVYQGGNWNVSVTGTVGISADGSLPTVETRKQTPTGKALNVQIGPGDVISNIPVIVEYDHHQLHEGEIFRWSSYTPSLAGSANKDLRLVVPNIAITTNAVTQCPHLRFEFISSVGGLAYLHEGTTFNTTGTIRTPIAMERNGTYTSKLLLYEDPTINVLGTLLWQGLVLSNNRAGGTDGSEMEFILKNNTEYSVRFTSGGASNQVMIRLIWYEDLGV